MSIDVPNLDNRKFQELVDEAKRKIPGYAPEWTNHNVSDPGVALIELFAWMTELTLYQLNQLPDHAMKQLLSTVGFEMYPAQAAVVDLEFQISHPTATSGLLIEAPPPVLIPRGTEVGTVGLDDNVTFATQEPLALYQPVLRQCLQEPTSGARVEPRFSDASGLILRPLEFHEPLICFTGIEESADVDARALRSGTAVFFGFDRPLSRAIVQVSIKAETKGLGIDEERAPIVWEATTGSGFDNCKLIDDETGGLNVDGDLRIQMPADHQRATLPVGGDDLYWLVLRLDTDAVGPMYTESPRIDEIAFTTIGGVVGAANVRRHTAVEVGRSDETPGQCFSVGESIVFGEENVSLSVAGESWRYVPDFTGTSDADRVFTVDAVFGEIQFAPMTRLPDGMTRRHGAIPQKDATIVIDYSTGGGAPGNRIRPNTVTNLHQALAYVDAVTNRVAPTPARDSETIDEAMERAPSTVRAGDRAVTAADFERIVRDADRNLERVVCLPATSIDATDATGASVGGRRPIQVLILPPVTKRAALHELDDFALTPEFRTRITTHLRPRLLVGTRVELKTPKFLGVSVAVRVRCKKGFERDTVNANVEDVLYEFLNPIVGGEKRSGLGLGETMTQERIEARVVRVDGVRRIESLEIYEADLRRKQRLGRRPTRRIEIDPDTVLLSFRHVVHVEEEDA